MLSDLQGVGPIVGSEYRKRNHPVPMPPYLAKSCARNFLHRGEWMTARSLTLLISLYLRDRARKPGDDCRHSLKAREMLSDYARVLA